MSKSKEKERPGVILYFDALSTLEKMSSAAQAAFAMACLHYGRDMAEPHFDELGLDPVNQARLETLWDLTRPRIDSDAQGWRDGILQRKYAGYCSGCERKGETAMTFEDYRAWYDTASDRGIL